jgi:hypothetical protein
MESHADPVRRPRRPRSPVAGNAATQRPAPGAAHSRSSARDRRDRRELSRVQRMYGRVQRGGWAVRPMPGRIIRSSGVGATPSVANRRLRTIGDVCSVASPPHSAPRHQPADWRRTDNPAAGLRLRRPPGHELATRAYPSKGGDAKPSRLSLSRAREPRPSAAPTPAARVLYLDRVVAVDPYDADGRCRRPRHDPGSGAPRYVSAMGPRRPRGGVAQHAGMSDPEALTSPTVAAPALPRRPRRHGPGDPFRQRWTHLLPPPEWRHF